MANPYKFTLFELLAILVGALLVNAYLVHRDRAEAARIAEETRAAAAFVGPPVFCADAPERDEVTP